MSTKQEREQFEELKKTAYQINPKKVQREQAIFYLSFLFISIITIMALVNIDALNYQNFFLTTMIAILAGCALSVPIIIYSIKLKKIIEINNKEIQHSKENVEY